MAYASYMKREILPIQVDSAATAGTYVTWTPVGFGGVVYDITFWTTVQQAGTVTTAPVLTVGTTLSGTSSTDVVLFTGSTSNTGNLAVLGKEYEPDNTNKLPIVFNAGDTITFGVKTAEAGGTTSAKGYFVIYYEIAPDALHS